MIKSNYIDKADWDDPKKTEAREQSIILAYQNYFNKTSIPKNKQYWTMCGSHFNNNGKIDGELGQLVQSNLITPDQFHGVDINADIIKSNKKYYPDVSWYQNDFIEAMKNSYINNSFNPAIINCDNVRMPKNAVKYLKKLLLFIDNNFFDELLLVANLMLTNPYRQKVESSGEEVIDKLINKYAFPDHWTIDSQYYKYSGTGKRSRTLMGSFIFVKQKHEKIKFTKGRKLKI